MINIPGRPPPATIFGSDGQRAPLGATGADALSAFKSEKTGLGIALACQEALDDLGGDEAEGNSVAAITQYRVAVGHARDGADRWQPGLAFAEGAGPGKLRLKVQPRH